MVALPLFKLATLFVRHISKYGANRIKHQAHEHPAFRAFAAKYGQYMHQINMRLSVVSVRNAEAETKAREKAEAPTVLTKEQAEKQEAIRQKHGTTAKENRARRQIPLVSIWRRKFRPLPEAKAVDLFADVIGDAFILGVAGAIIIYESWKSSQKPDVNAEKIKDLTRRLEELEKMERQHANSEKDCQARITVIEDALRMLKNPQTKQPVLAPAPAEEAPVPATSPPA